MHFSGPKDNLKAEIYLKSEILDTIDLSKEDQPRLLTYEGLHTDIVVEVKKNAIRVNKSGCPKQVCVQTGWVDQGGHSIVCAYNGIFIKVLGGNTDLDVIV